MFETHKTQNSNNISQNQESKTKSMKYRLRIEKPILFSWRFEVEKMQKWRFFEIDTMSFREVWNGEDNEQLEMFEGKIENI